jgi:hypothetical protein
MKKAPVRLIHVVITSIEKLDHRDSVRSAYRPNNLIEQCDAAFDFRLG